MPEPTTVWMVHARTGLQGIRGVLSLDAEGLWFRPEDLRRADTRIPLTAIRKVRRAYASPVLEVAVDLPDHPRLIGFYFVKPPPLPGSGRGEAPIFGRWLAKRRAVAVLREGNVRRGEEVTRWVREVRMALEG
jgi:hypothetical protein